MTRKQETRETEPPARGAGVLVLRTFHVDFDEWTRFGALTRAKGSNCAAELRRLIAKELEDEGKRP